MKAFTAAELAVLKETVAALEGLDQHRTFRKVEYFRPYKKQLEFFRLGRSKRERLLMAGNQLGKSDAGAIETSFHLTGDYPDWWPGRQWDRPVTAWAAGETALVARDVQQKKLCGTPGVTTAFGTGLIPKERFADKPSMSRSATDAFDTIQVAHASGGVSILKFKSYEQGRTKFQGDTLDFVWLDEEPAEDIYSEALTRVTATKGMVFLTFTPLKGRSSVVLRYTDEPSPDRVVVTMTIDDVAAEIHGHITPEDRDTIVAGYLPHERDARAKGIPILGSGRVFMVAEDDYLEDPLEFIPPHWAVLVSLDFGIGHPFAWILMLWDRDNDVIHVHVAQRMSDAVPAIHARNILLVASEAPVAWPHDGAQREKGSGKPLKNLYKAEGLKMLDKHAQFEDGSNSVEAGILEMDQRLKTGRLKISRGLLDLIEEIRFYHRKDGQIVKIKDDLIDAMRGAVMMKRFARPVPLGGSRKRSRNQQIAHDVDFDMWAG